MTLLTALVSGEDDGAAVRVGDATLDREALLGAATAVADEVAGAPAVAVHAQPSTSTVVGVLGCLLAGAPAVPISPDAGPLERDHILRDSRATLILGQHPWEGLAIPTVPLDTAARSSASHPGVAPDAAALILYTSGTTGPPKGVVVSHSAIANDLDALADAWAWSSSDVLVHGLPLFHVHGLVLGVLGPLRVGSRLVHTVRPRPEAYARAKGTLYFGVPTVWSRICGEPACARALARARLLVSGSAALPASIFDLLTELTGSRPIERYGMTETLITVSVRSDGERRAGWVGEPVAGVQTRLVDEAGNPLAHDGESIGELQVRGPTLFKGYLGQPEVTAASFVDGGWFRTGDAAVIAADGYHRIVGRQSTDIIKTGGYRVGAGEVESALLSHPAVREAAVLGVPDDDLGQRIAAFVVAPDLGDVDLAGFVASQLSVHKRPRDIHLVDSLPRNPMGKVQKTALVEPP